MVYYTRSGNARVVAQHIRLTTSGTLFEIVPVDSYPEDYNETVSQAGREDKGDYEPPLKNEVADIASFKTVFLGFPIWGMTMPPAVRSFLSRHDLSNKTIVPFVTHGGYGIGDSLSILRRKAAGVAIRDAFSLKADQEKQTVQQLAAWLTKSDINL